ncbi:MAG: zinc ribbon domain-containing protein [Nitrospirae bacterium]|nr:zinc ribbon domain-containing protein [Nitrospirota bacterium]
MPIFEYNCNKCHCDFEMIVSSKTVVECEKCGSKDVKKKMSVFGTSGTDKHVHSGGGSSCGGCHKSSCSTC